MRTPGRAQVQQDSTCSRKPFVFKLRKPQQTEEAVANATASPEFDTAIQGNKDFEAQRSRQEQPVNDVQPQKHMVRFLTSFPIFIHCLCFKIYKNHFEPQNSNQDASEEMTHCDNRKYRVPISLRLLKVTAQCRRIWVSDLFESLFIIRCV